jgi:transcriptional regulator of acetoin/glycerol metabolism
LSYEYFVEFNTQTLGTILPLGKVKRRVIVDALDKYGGNYLLAAHLLGIGRTTIYRMGRMYRVLSAGLRNQ